MDILLFDNFTAYVMVKKEAYVALENISLSLPAGEFISVVGPSGCGKTTFLRSVLGLMKYTDGKVYLNGKDVKTIEMGKQNVSYVSQEYGVYPSMTVYENIAYPLRNSRCPFEEMDRRVKEMAKRLELSLFLTRKPKQLSGGQNQRVALGRALIKNPQLALFDEPFSNLDTPLRLELGGYLRALQKELNTTVLFVTHRLEEAYELSDRIVKLENGKVKDIILKQDFPVGGVI